MSPGASEQLQWAQGLLKRRDLTEAIAGFDQAEWAGAAADTCAGGRWMAHMLAGDFAAAWHESDLIRSGGQHDPHRFWLGEDLRNRRVILRCLHGLGDAVQFFRYVPRLRNLAGHLKVEVPPAMLEIARCFHGISAVTTWDIEATAARDWDFQVEIMELPYLFRTQLGDLPVAERYLRVPAGTANDFDPEMECGRLPRIGVVWSAGEWDTTRSVPMERLHALLTHPGCEFWNLQGGSAWQEWRDCPPEVKIQDAPGCRGGILPLASAISALDLLITVDTLAAHLAGAMGKPTWLLLQRAADWRWMTGRNDSPWYPSLRLFRQRVQGDWGSVVCDVSRHLEQWLRCRTEPPVTA